MEQKNFEKNQKFLVLLMTNVFFCLLTLNSRADIITRHNFNQVRCFFYSQYGCLYWIFPRIYFFEKCGFACQNYEFIWQFLIHKSQHNTHLLVFVRKCYKKQPSRSSKRRLISKCQGNLVMKFILQYIWVTWDIRYIIVHVSFYFLLNIMNLPFCK